ncbi:MAG: hypothetical protein ABJH04_20355 [Cyclobacteriaceae bacterium]
MMRKGLLLFLALLQPVIIFLFLHFFGKNEFEVPVLYQTEDDLPGNCEMEYSLPYTVKSEKVDVADGAVILFSAGLTNEMFDNALFQLSRLQDEFGEDSPQIIVLKKNGNELPAVDGEIIVDEYDFEQQCVFLANANRIVLVDTEGHIRGLYPNASLKEIDRLILELKIIFKQY